MKYSIGDKVNYYGKDYTIKLWNARIDKDGIHVSYSFHAYCDKHFDYHQLVPEDFLSGHVVEPHPNSVEVEHMDAFGNAIELNDTVLSGIIRPRMDGTLRIDADLAFVSYDCVTAFVYEQEAELFDESKPKAWINHMYSGYRLGIFNDENGNSLHNGRRYGQACNEWFGSAVSMKLTESDKDQIAEMYVHCLRSHKDHLRQFTGDGMWLQKEYLKRIDVLERVKVLLDKPKPKTATKPKRKRKPESDAEMWKRIAMNLAKQANVDINDLVGDN